MTDKLQLAVNHAMNDAISRARMAMANPTMGIDAKRTSAWCEYGFKQTLTFDDLYNLFRRGGIAYGGVTKLNGHCWKTSPQVIEGDKADKSKKETGWEASLKKLVTKRIWREFKEADQRRLVGRYSGLILHINDGSKWHEPVKTSKLLKKVTPAWASAIKPTGWVTDINSLDYGQPKLWQYTESLPNGGTRNINIHPDRVFILGDYSIDAIGFLEPAYNAFVSLEKVEGGSGESFLKNAARQMNINFDKEINFSNLASMYGVSVEDLQGKFNEAAAEINRGNDTLLTTQGASITQLVSPVSDPTPTYTVNLQTAAAALDIPSKILVGMQTGERASTEDQKYFNSRCQSRRESELSFEIEDFIDHLTRIKVLEPIPEKTVIWDDLNEQSATEKLDSGEKMSRINQTSLATGEPVFTVEEIRTAAGYENESDEPLGELDEDTKDKDRDKGRNESRSDSG
ncbi:anti-CBASS protein Acb1 family protein [Providencia sp. Je.9.19]|uniref:anti-CBASS protein Acb1 family protein n=1 Tax=Providencia sp. Je.9.19 TaxID=3142844 RepID=UPI003DA816E7